MIVAIIREWENKLCNIICLPLTHQCSSVYMLLYWDSCIWRMLVQVGVYFGRNQGIRCHCTNFDGTRFLGSDLNIIMISCNHTEKLTFPNDTFVVLDLIFWKFMFQLRLYNVFVIIMGTRSFWNINMKHFPQHSCPWHSSYSLKIKVLSNVDLIQSWSVVTEGIRLPTNRTIELLNTQKAKKSWRIKEGNFCFPTQMGHNLNPWYDII